MWLKDRTTANSHNISDSVRGPNKTLFSNATNAETAGSSTPFLSSFNSNGFTIGGNGDINTNNNNYVAWCWKAGGSASSNSNGTITSSVSASTTYGFSVVTWTGAGTGSAKTVGHSLGAVPKFIITKSRTLTDNWGCYHASLGNTKDIFLNTTGIPRSYPTWNNTDPTSSVFSVGQTGQVNEAGATYVAYCWSEISGYSKFSSYTGNGSNPGPVVTTGFKPRFLVVKRTDAVDNWTVFDSARNLNNDLKWNTSELEGTAPVEFLSSGFQFKNTYGSTNANGGTYIYAAFASKPDQSALDVLLDSPSQSVADETDTGLGGQITGNYATFNPVNSNTHSAYYTLSDGNLKFTAVGGSSISSGSRGFCVSSIGMSSGKYYFELKFDVADNNDHAVGIAKATGTGYYSTTGNWTYQGSGTKWSNSGGGAAYGASYTAGDTIGVAFDADTGALVCYKNGISQGTLVTVPTGETYFFVWGTDSGSSSIDYEATANFGQRAFSYTAPSGFKCLTVENLTTPTIADGSQYFDTKLWTGDGASTRTISNYGFSPDFIWIKNRTTSGWQHVLYDQIRGAGTGSVTKSLSTDSTRSEASGNDTNHGYLSGFTSDGYSLVKGSQSGGDYVNHNSWDYVGWAWDAGDSTTTVAAGANGTNLPGTACQVRANPSAGFSIVKVDSPNGTEARVHGLNAKPELIICKSTAGSDSWHTYVGSYGYQHYINLNSNGAISGSSDQFGSQEPNSTYFYVKTNTGAGTNKSGGMIYYCFAPVANYSAIDRYTGNGSSDGIFIHTGFKPAFLLTKRTNASENWEIRDNRRNPSNRVNRALFPHTSGAEDNGSVDVDFLSNGFKIRTANGSMNASGGIYLYYAVAEEPFKTARAR